MIASRLVKLLLSCCVVLLVPLPMIWLAGAILKDEDRQRNRA